MVSPKKGENLLKQHNEGYSNMRDKRLAENEKKTPDE